MSHHLDPFRYEVTGGGGGGIVIEDHTTNTANNVTSITLTKPTGSTINDDDLLIIVGSDASNTGWSVPAGWTAIVQDNVFGCTANAAYRYADGTEGSTVSYGNSTSYDKVGAYIHISGNAASSVINAQDSACSGANGTSYTIAALTSTVTDTKAIYVQGYDGGDGSPFSITGGTGWTELLDLTTGGAGSDASMSVGYKDVAAIGTTGSVTISASGAGDGWATFMFVVAPA